MRFVFVIALLLGSALPAIAQIPQRARIKPPVLKNRTEILAERQRLANQLLDRGDSVLIRVYIYVDENGVTRYPEIKTPSGNPRADAAAVALVRKMVWHPAENTKRGVMVTVPVMFVRK